MKLTCRRQSLSNAFQTVAGVVPTRTPKDILRNIKLSVRDGVGTLVGTDQEVGIRYELSDVQTDSAGDVLLPTQRVALILREVQDDSVQIEVTPETLLLRSGRSEFRLSLIDPAEFPDVPPFGDASYFNVSGKVLRAGIQRTIFAADVESARYALGGLLLDFQKDGLHLAATDTRRLAVCCVPVSRAGDSEIPAQRPIVPSKAMTLIERSIADPEQDVHIAVHHNDIQVRTGGITLYSRLVEGRFPAYQDVIPTESEKRIELVAGPFLSAVRQAMIVTNDESRGVEFAFEGDTLTLRSVGADIGSSRVELPVSYGGEAISVLFDPKFVADFVKAFDSSCQITLGLNDPNSAALFTAEGVYSYVVMPLARDD